MRATVTQLAAYVGKSERTIQRRLASGKWPHTRLAGGLVEIDDSLLFEPESEQEGLLLATLQRIEQKLDKLSADVAMLSASKPARVHVHTEQAEYTPRPAPGPAQGNLPEGLTPFREYCEQMGYSPTTVKRWIDNGQVPAHRGKWKRSRGYVELAVDEEGMRAIDRLYGRVE